MAKKWWIENGPRYEVVLSSRVRLARNLAEYPFPNMLDGKQRSEIVSKVDGALKGAAVGFSRNDMKELSETDRQILVEKHLISPDLARMDGSAFISEDEHISVMVNEEDHIRIQTMTAGFDLDKAYDTADKIDTVLENSLEYAFSEKFGYLTSCPTNVGTGMRASVMMHLPALCMTGEISRVINSVSKFGVAVRGLYGEGSKALGDIFQISNQITLGISEEETINNIKSVAESIIERETEVRMRLREENIIKLADRLWRSYGILKNAQVLSSDEFMKLASDVRLGAVMGIIGSVNTETLNELETAVQPAGITKSAEKELSPEQRDFERAKIVRERL